MRRSVLRGGSLVASAALLLLLSSCARSAPAARTAAAPAAAPVYDAWTTPPQAGRGYGTSPATGGALQPAPIAVAPGGAMPPPPPPPPPGGGYPVVGAPAAGAPVATGARPAPMGTTRNVWAVPERSYTCGLPCCDGISQWHVRGVLGRSYYSGTDKGQDCTYYGLDVGRTFCGCWGWDLYYRYNTGRFTREPTPGATFDDGGQWHHIGTKLTMERPFAGSRLYWWTGIGGGYFTTEKYIANDDGPEVFGEAGLAYVLSRNWRVRAGVNVHGMDTKVTRRRPVNDGQKRWLWIIAPVIEVEYSF